MMAQLSVPGQSPASGPSTERLHPYLYAQSNMSKTSVSVSVRSTYTHRGTHLDVTGHRPEARPSSRAAARGISRVASRAPSRTSRATSRSRTRAPSPSPSWMQHDLPTATITLPSAGYPSEGTPNSTTLAIPNPDTVSVNPDSILSTSLLREDRIWPVLAIPRYDDYPIITPERADWELKPVTLRYNTETVPADWIARVHPEGRLYFYHPEKRIFTDADIRQKKFRAILQAFEETLDDMVQAQGLILPPNYELVLYLEERKISGGYNWLYYYVDHANRTLFWVQEFDIIDSVDEVRGLKTLSQIQPEVEAKYWAHCEMYPYGHNIPEEVFNDLSGMLLFASIDVLTSMTSTVVYRPDDVHRMLGLVKSAKGVRETDYATVAIVHQRFLNMHGQTYARLGRDQSIYNTVKQPRTALIKLLAPLFFNAPEVHLRGLEKIWIDNIIAIQPWSGFIGKLQNEWQEFVLYATVLLNANVAFLAIPSVDDGSGNLTAPQISSYLSIVASVGSILLGLLLIRQHRVKSKETADEAWRYLSSRKHPTLGLETLAIIYSLPYALLMWGMVTFLLSFSFECFANADKAGIYSTAAAWIIVAILVVWTIITGWEGGETSMWERLREWRSWIFPEKDHEEQGGEDAVSTGARSVSEKAAAKAWFARMFRYKASFFPHSNDPPTTEMEARGSSTV
ncbi:hypothetical protein PYCCODRAFT_1445733 [Trametes coccinea BRFM310]|uniref:WW domain-containing protein n=1 Tax=Trametes coccinea (strain BRFM310) TaxID=1353009 RepID=A0A1Y2IND6_TRAC3|nr:hypothetical protein PYCCODRAFT_1445733 [Trametes coccinea BRFM310]